MTRRMLLTALAASTMAAALPGKAEAVAYRLVDQVVTVPNPIPGIVSDYVLSFVVSEAAVARGTFQLSGSGSFSDPPSLTGDTADFSSLSILGGTGTSARFPGALRQFSVTFAPDRTVSSFALSALIDAGDVLLSGSSGSSVSGSFGTDRPDCNSQASTGLCRVRGRLTEIPEPMSLTLLGMGLLGMVAVRRAS